jgi:tol-pal system protein YbgF
MIAVFAAIAALSGCYGKQIVKGPIYTEQISERTDSVLAEQQDTQRLIRDLRDQLAEEREARVRYQAQIGLTIGELEESVRVLTSRLEDQKQLQYGGAGTRRSFPPPSNTRPAAPDTARSVADSLEAASRAAGEAAAELYRTSYMDLTRGNYALAIQGFQQYLVRFPTGPQQAEVHYYLAECYYAEDRHLESVAEFQYVVREFPDSRLVPAAYLKSGLCYVALEERALATKSFNDLIEKYPDSEEAKQARDELERSGG